MTILPPDGPNQSPAGAPPPPPRNRLAALGRRLNWRLAAIFTLAGCLVAASFAYTLHERALEEAYRRAAEQARPQSADASSWLDKEPNGNIQPAAMHIPNLSPAREQPAPHIKVPPAPPETMAEQERKTAWKDYYAQLQLLREARYKRALKAVDATGDAVIGGQLGGGASGTTAASPSTPQQPPAAPSTSSGPGQQFDGGGYGGYGPGFPGSPYGFGFGGGFGEPARVDTAAQEQKVAWSGGGNNAQITRSPPIGPYGLTAATYIPSTLISLTVSDAPGHFTARVSRAVYNNSGTCEMIPQDAKILGVYNSLVSNGQTRLPGVITDIIYPDGSELPLGRAEADDMSGAAGFEDKVNRHFWAKLGNAVILGIAGAGIQLSFPQNNGNGYSSQQIIAASMGQQLGQLGIEYARSGLTIPDTITIRQGYNFNIILDKTIPYLPPWSCNGMQPRPQLPIMTAN